jgi:hypothetical protein
MLQRQPVQMLKRSIVISARELELCKPKQNILYPR